MKILAIDIGSYSIKAVILDSAFSRIELGDYFVEKITEPAAQPIDPKATEKDKDKTKKVERKILSDGQADALKKILAKPGLKFDRIAINVPRVLVTNRTFTFPTRNRKTIQSSIQFELEDEIPFPIENTMNDFSVIKTEGSNSTIFTSIALKDDLITLLSEVQLIGIDPDMITADAWATSHLLRKAMPQGYQAKPHVVMNMGSAQTTIQVFVGSDPIMTHVSSVGGNHLTHAIASNYGISLEEAEKAKIDGAFFLTETHLRGEGIQITDAQRQFSSILEDAIAPLIRELKQVIIAYKSQYQHMVKSIFVTGGASLIPNLPLYLEERIQVPVYHYNYISNLVGQTLQLSEANESLISNAVGLALTLIKPDRNTTINLRKDELSKKGGGIGTINVQSYKKVLIASALALAFIYANIMVQYFVLKSRSTAQEASLERAVKSVLGAVSPSMMKTYLASPSVMKTAVEKELAKYKENQPVNVKPQLSGFDLLNKISASMPRDMTLDVSLFQLKEGKLRLDGMVDKMTNADRIQKALEDTKLLTDIKKEKADQDMKKRAVKFGYVAALAPETPAIAPKKAEGK